MMNENPMVVVVTALGNRLHGRAAWAERYIRRHPGATIETERSVTASPKAEPSVESEQATPAPAPSPASGGDSALLEDLDVSTTVREALIEAGYQTPEQIDAATDDELLGVDGVGPATLAKLRRTPSPGDDAPVSTAETA